MIEIRILVIDVAAQHGGSVTILEQFIEEFRRDKKNQYYVALSTLSYQSSDNVSFLNYDWVKKSHLHRLFFDTFYIKKLVKEVRADRILSLQNKTVSVNGIPQDVYFHNALPLSDKRFSLLESKDLWVYQNVIGMIVKCSLKRACRIMVQADWIKKQLVSKWHINEEIIKIKRPVVLSDFASEENDRETANNLNALFYPASSALYKNHENLLLACVSLWNKNPKRFRLILTGHKNMLSDRCKSILEKGDYPVEFVGQLNHAEMQQYYQTTVLAFPSYIETVGLPLIEAKRNHGLILAADCEYAHESLGAYPNVRYFDPFDVNSIISVIDSTIIPSNN